MAKKRELLRGNRSGAKKFSPFREGFEIIAGFGHGPKQPSKDSLELNRRDFLVLKFESQRIGKKKNKTPKDMKRLREIAREMNIRTTPKEKVSIERLRRIKSKMEK